MKNLALPLDAASLASVDSPAPSRPWRAILGWTALAAAAAFLVGTLVWAAVTASGTPDPTREATGSGTALFDIGVLVFREGLECILVLSAIMAGMKGPQSSQRQPVAWGAGAGFLASVATWFVAVGIIDALSENISALKLQAATGLVAVVVLLVVMNWFFHKVYWGGWITLHNTKRKELVQGAAAGEVSRKALYLGLAALGFTTFYREGFEVVLFLQTYRLKLGNGIVMGGLGIGLLLSGIIAVLTFVAHRRLPYRKMLIFTGVLLGAVLLLMVGEQAQEMQLAGWLPKTEIKALGFLPDWAGLWFSVFPTVETLAAQALTAALVIGSYFAARGQSKDSPAPQAVTNAAESI